MTHAVNEGTIIHGTLRNRDVIPALIDYLETMPIPESERDEKRMDKEGLVTRSALVKSFREDFRGKNPESEWADEICFEVCDAIESYLPEGFYCGAIEGDGSDFGVWRVDTEEE